MTECNCLMCLAEGENSPHRRRTANQNKEIEAVGWAILQALHEGVEDGPQSWSDLAGDQERRIKRAAVAAIESVTDLAQFSAQGFSWPKRDAASLTEKLIQAAVDYESGRCSRRELSEAREAVEAGINGLVSEGKQP